MRINTFFRNSSLYEEFAIANDLVNLLNMVSLMVFFEVLSIIHIRSLDFIAKRVLSLYFTYVSSIAVVISLYTTIDVCIKNESGRN